MEFFLYPYREIYQEFLLALWELPMSFMIR
jgi:hypothetical protein